MRWWWRRVYCDGDSDYADVADMGPSMGMVEF